MPGLLQVSKHCVPVSTLPYTAMLVGKGEMREQDEDQGVPVLIAIKFQCKALCSNCTRRRAARAARAHKCTHPCPCLPSVVLTCRPAVPSKQWGAVL